MRGGTLAVLLALVVAGPRLHAQVEDVGVNKRFRAIVNGAFAPTSLSYDETRQVTEFAEPGTLEASYKDDPGPGLDLGLQYNFTRHLGVLAGFSRVSRSGGGTFAASLPHPLYFNQHRKAEGSLDGYDYSESAGHLDLVASRSRGAFELAVFAGATRFSVKTDVVERLQYSHSYPYDSVTVTGTPKRRFSQSPMGFNVGGRLDWGLGRAKRVGVGLQLRYSRASVEIVPSEGNTLKFDAGGLQLGLGARLFF